MVQPILTYCCEVWGYSLFGENNWKRIKSDNLENLYNTKVSPGEKAILKFCKVILRVPTNTDNLIPYGELGIYPLYIFVIIQVLKYWSTMESSATDPLMVTSDTDSLLREALELNKTLHNGGFSTWFSFVLNMKQLLLGPNAGNDPPSKREISLIKRELVTRFEEAWFKKLSVACKLRTYRTFKLRFGMETYLQTIKNSDVRASLTKFRASAHRLMIEAGRHQKLNLEDRVCPMCDLGAIEDELHFVTTCPFYAHARKVMMEGVKTVFPP